MRCKTNATKNCAEPDKNICIRPYVVVGPGGDYRIVEMVQESKYEIPDTEVKLPAACDLFRHGCEDVRNASVSTYLQYQPGDNDVSDCDANYVTAF